MANNVEKYKVPDRSYNNRLVDRFNYILKRLELYKEGIDDDNDLEWNIKDGVVGEINFSEEAMKMVINNRNKIHPIRTRPIVLEIFEKGCFKIIKDDGTLRCAGLEIADFFAQSRFPKKINLEHAIPYSFYSKELVRLYELGKFDVEQFRHFMSSIHLCVILNDENVLLDKTYKSEMPQGWKWGDDPFARYDKNNIKIWKGRSL